MEEPPGNGDLPPIDEGADQTKTISWPTTKAKSWKIEAVKAVVEIIAIVVGGIWTGYEYLYKRSEERSRRESFSWMVLHLDGNVTQLSSTRAWLFARLRIRNDSKRPVFPFIVSWWVKYPPVDGLVNPTPYKQWNTGVTLDLQPGQETEISTPVVLELEALSVAEISHRSVLVRVEVISKSLNSEDECFFDPDLYHHQLTREEFEHMHGQPKLCLADCGRRACKKGEDGRAVGCPMEYAQGLFQLPAEMFPPSPSETKSVQTLDRR